MPMTREEEERQRIAKAFENVEKWQERYGGFSGGFRVIHEVGGVRHVQEQMIGDPVVAAKVVANSPFLPDANQAAEIGRMAVAATVSPPQKNARRPRYSWLAWLFDLISVEE